MTHPFEEEKVRRSELCVIYTDGTTVTHEFPDGTSTWIVGVHWVTVPKGGRRMVGPVAHGTPVRLASEGDVLDPNG